ncbi:type 2 periplasmic-binding domain-containing protein [Cohnella fermenti]|nr:extracellular solute-binding protein [Cohnella fermenti]
MKKQLTIAIASVAMLASLLTACGGNNDNNKAAESAGTTTNTGSAPASGAASAKPLKVSVMTQQTAPMPPAADNEIEKLIEKATNTELDVQWIPQNTYGDKLNITLAAGDLPDLIFINDPFSSVFRGLVDQGAFWDLSPYYKDYPNLTSGISETAWELTKQADGGNYGIPRPRPSEGAAFLNIRKDWLDEVGLAVPTTTDELYAALKAIKDKKGITPFPAGVDASGLNLGYLATIESAFTSATWSPSYGGWKLADGKLTNTAFLPEERSAIEYLKKLFDEKLISEDFASIKTDAVNNLFKADKSALIVEKAGNMRNYFDEIVKLDTDFKETDFYPMTTLNGFSPRDPGFNGLISIPKSVSEEKMKGILKMVDTWMNDDVFQYQQWGIEGVHYTVQDGKKVLDTEKANQDGISNYNQIVYVSDPYASSSKDFFEPDTQTLYKQIQDEREKAGSVPDYTVGLNSPTANQNMTEINKSMTDLKIKIILGSAPITAWDDYVNKLKSDATMTKITEELNDAYQKRTGAN